MSEDTNPTATAPATTPAPVEYVEKEFEAGGKLAGFRYIVPQYNTLDAAIAAIGAINILALTNGGAAARIRTKAHNDSGITDAGGDAVKEANIKAALSTKTGGILFTQEQAKSWQPDVRESSFNQLQKQARELLGIRPLTQENVQKAQGLLAKAMQIQLDSANRELAAVVAT